MSPVITVTPNSSVKELVQTLLHEHILDLQTNLEKLRSSLRNSDPLGALAAIEQAERAAGRTASLTNSRG
jgi:hypothetical protein